MMRLLRSDSRAMIKELVYDSEILFSCLIPGVVMSPVWNLEGKMFPVSNVEFCLQLIHQLRWHKLITFAFHKQNWNMDAFHFVY